MLIQSSDSLRRYAAYGKEILPDPDMQPHGPRGMRRVIFGAPEDPPEEQLARFLGVFSLALGALELLAPRRLGRLIGMPGGHGILPLLGIREIGHGLAILSGRRPAAAVSSRIAGDAIDLAVLGAVLVVSPRRQRALVATLAVLGITLLDALTARQLTERRSQIGRASGPFYWRGNGTRQISRVEEAARAAH